ncbi:MAG: universal stress protein [Methylococcales symbiont of Iophon sp. n. MRB-2018]|nr:MAG: universal stress protein [Methylococcales symbiont of Iophon sp. n. MRB-2018]KAF3979875.1 MAG: universal stress protein [Methylococcales symbiont of Iophon sp. n. MRB-2018]
MPCYQHILLAADFTEHASEVADRAKQLAKMAADSDILETKQYMELGSPKRKIVSIAKQQNVDLLVVGSHGRHGLALLLASTANAVLHHAACDVLAVRLKND